jgi:pyridoxal phosphate enzyme (YggS family)
MFEQHSIIENWKRISHEVAESSIACGRNPDSVTIIAVSKMHPLDAVKSAWEGGARVFGENYAQEFRDKVKEAKESNFNPEWHFIGSLQSNKVKYIVPHAAMIHSCSSQSVAEEIDRLSQKSGLKTDILIQVNTSGEASKSGIHPDAIQDYLEGIVELKYLQLRGLMTIPTATDDLKQLMKEFTVLRTIHENIKSFVPNPNEWNILSMGMSDDFSIAIQEGATHVRIGTAIFGARAY